MLLKFTVAVFAEPGTTVGVVGSVASLGDWDLSSVALLRPLTAIKTSLVPTCFTGCVEIPELLTTKVVHFKFVRERGKSHTLDPAKTAAPFVHVGSYAGEGDSDIVQFGHLVDRLEPIKDVIWEGEGSKYNRCILTEMGTEDKEQLDPRLSHLIDEKNWTTYTDMGKIYLLPPMDFMERETETELGHTTKYYYFVKDHRLLHYNRIVPRVFCGSCPRRIEHIEHLKTVLNVKFVVNLQTTEDIMNNFVEEVVPLNGDSALQRLHELYLQHGIYLAHIPTTDMCTKSRAAMMTKGACIAANLLAGDPNSAVYIHCNAGVGRAVACTVALIHFYLGVSEAHTLHLVKSNRPVAFLDVWALRNARGVFDKFFAQAAKQLTLQ